MKTFDGDLNTPRLKDDDLLLKHKIISYILVSTNGTYLKTLSQDLFGTCTKAAGSGIADGASNGSIGAPPKDVSTNSYLSLKADPGP